jgi:hypothetical protein
VEPESSGFCEVQNHFEEFFMMAARLLQIIASVAALVAVALGMATYTHADFTSIHMLFGLIVALVLLVLAVMAAFTAGLRQLGVLGIVYAFILPIFGVTQQMILPGDLHWLIETAHLLVGFGAIAFLGMISTGFLRLRQTARNVSGQP